MSRQPKMVSCTQCGKEFAAGAKMCPFCGAKNKKPFYKKWWFWVIAVLIVVGAMGSGGKGGTEKEAKTETSSGGTEAQKSSGAGEQAKAETTAAETAPVKDIYYVGDTLHDGNLDIVYTASGDYVSDNEFMQPPEGSKYIFLEFAFANTSDKSDSSISFYSFNCFADGYACDAYYGGSDDLSATLSPGRTTEGKVYFTVPKDAQEIEVEYTPNVLFSKDKIKFAFEGEKDSGYELQKNTQATEGALKVGERTESKSMAITYLSCIEDHSGNQFITPKDGCRYVTCEFEFENLTSSDQHVSSFSFDCFADGVSCDGAFFRDDNISASISAGRKAKGTVTFEVPTDAQVVEVEFLTNFWTSNRVVFDAKVN